MTVDVTVNGRDYRVDFEQQDNGAWSCRVNGDAARDMHYQILREGEDHLSLHQLYVHPEHRNHGIGSQLVAKLFAAAASNGIHRHFVMSANQDWEKTMRFYQKQWFRPWYFRMFTGSSTEER